MTFPYSRPMQVDDLDAIMPLERQSFKDPWTRHMYVTDLTDNAMASYMVLVPGEEEVGRAVSLPSVLAYGGMWLMVDAAHIATLCTHPNWRGCGFAGRLLLDLLELAVKRGATISTLEVRESNLPAQRLYLKLGYQVVGKRRRYYRDGEDGLIMTTPPLHDSAMVELLATARAATEQRMRKCPHTSE